MATANKTITVSALISKWKTNGSSETLRKFLASKGIKPVFETNIGRGTAYYYNVKDVEPYRDEYLQRGRKLDMRATPAQAHAGRTNVMSWQTMIARMNELHAKMDNIVPNALSATLVALITKVDALEAQVKMLNETWGVQPPATELPPIKSGEADDE